MPGVGLDFDLAHMAPIGEGRLRRREMAALVEAGLDPRGPPRRAALPPADRPNRPGTEAEKGPDRNNQSGPVICDDASRGGGIRTHDLFVPNEARYQAAPHPA